MILKKMGLFAGALLIGVIIYFNLYQKTQVPNDLRPPVSVLGARQILEGDGWKIVEPSDLTEPGCIKARLNQLHEGKVCFVSCGGRSSAEIASRVGESYGYQIGEIAKCAFYTVFSGSPEFRKTLFKK